MYKTFTMNFPAYTGNENRKIYVYLPKNYNFFSKTEYPVLYMFDGHNAFFDNDATYGKSWGVGRYLNRYRVPMIVVGVDCNHAPEAARIIEYAPFDFDIPESWIDPEGDPEISHWTKGYGYETMKWFTEVLKPEIDRRFHTIRDRSGTFIMGSSMGGLMSLYALCEFNQYYSKACALSPDFEAWYDATDEMIQKLDYIPDTELFIDYGTEESDFEEAGGAIGYFTKCLMEKGVDVTARIVPHGTHCEAAWEKELPFCINMLMFDKGDNY